MVTILMMILVIGLDHLTKYMAISLKEGDIIIFDKFLKLTYLENSRLGGGRGSQG